MNQDIVNNMKSVYRRVVPLFQLCTVSSLILHRFALIQTLDELIHSAPNSHMDQYAKSRPIVLSSQRWPHLSIDHWGICKTIIKIKQKYNRSKHARFDKQTKAAVFPCDLILLLAFYDGWQTNRMVSRAALHAPLLFRILSSCIVQNEWHTVAPTNQWTVRANGGGVTTNRALLFDERPLSANESANVI